MQADVLLREEQLEQDAKTKGAHRERKLIQKAIEKGTLNKYISAKSVLVRYSNVPAFELPWYKADWSRT
jgi:hypothetical protein